MNHNATAFHECMYIHYDGLLNNPNLAPAARKFLQKRQMMHAENYTAACRPPVPSTFSKLKGLFRRKAAALQIITKPISVPV